MRAMVLSPRGMLSLLSPFLSVALVVTAQTAHGDFWEARASAPGARAAHSAVWTEHELIVWGGGVDGQFLNTGGRYLPATDSWRTTSLSNAPSPRWFHAAVWTGSEMIIWGGRPNFSGDNNLNDGGRYNPATDSWRPISTQGAPARRSQCAAVWTGSEMVVWGGETEGGVPLADGARYDPMSDSWRPIRSSGLEARMEPTAIWTGSEMIVFGGVDATQPGWLTFGNGARYNPATDTWTPLPAEGAPSSRTGHTAVSTGQRMIIWGGRQLPSSSILGDGAIYNPSSNSWTPVFSYGSQTRWYHAATWTGSEMIVWGGYADQGVTLVNTGARYNPATGVWTRTTQEGAPGKRMFWRPDLGIWAGGGMLICAGSDYPASLDSTFFYRIDGTNTPPPSVETQTPSSVSATSMVLNASIKPNRQATTAWFIWGDSTNYGQVTVAQPMGSGSSVSNLAQMITGLSTGATYYYRAVASNDQGQVVLGNEQHLLLVPPGVAAYSVSHLSQTSARLDALAYPNGFPTYGWFEWGPTPALGQLTPVTYLGAQLTGGAWIGNNYLAGLQSSTTYYFRAVVSNSVGVLYGPTQSFGTPDANTCSYISPMERSHGYGATTDTVAINAPNICAWTVSSTNSWITILPDASGMGSGQAVYAVEANTDVLPRSGNIKVAGWNFSITQAGHYDVSKPADQTVALGGAATFSVTVHGTPPFTYQWQFNGTNLVDGAGVSGATTPTLMLSNVQYSQAGHYRVIVQDADSTTPSSSATLTVAPTGHALPLAEALDTGETFFWKTWSDPSGIWFGQTTTSHDGVDAAECSGLAPGGYASLDAKVDGAGILSFWWKTDFATPSDRLQFWMGNAQPATLATTTDWEQRTFTVPPGDLDLRWTLTSSAGAQSKAWLDQVQFTPCGFSLPSNFSTYLSYTGATAAITLDTIADCPWRVVNTNPWITILSGVENHGGGSVLYAVAANPTAAARVGTLFIAEQIYYVYQKSGVSNSADIPLAAALDTEGALEWSTIGTPEWFGQTILSRDGADAAQSGPVGDGGAVTATTSVNGPGTVLFWWKVSSETNKDYLKFFINGVQQTRISGEVDWQLLSYDLTSATNTLKWTYSKNASVAMGQDRGWLDQVQFIPASPTGGCTVAVSPTSATPSGNSETGLVYVVAAPGCGWDVVNTNSWITYVANPGPSNGTVRYTVSANNSRDPRAGVILIGGRPFTVTQANGLPPCAYSISQASRSHGAAAASGSIPVSATSGCAWSAFTTNDWITITSIPGKSPVTYSIPQNTSHFARTGVIVIADKIISINQSGAPISLAEALDIVGTPVSIWDAGSFYGQNSVTHDGLGAAQGNGIANFTLSINGPGTLSFWWKISSATNSYLRFFLDGSLQAEISGQAGWEQRTINLPAGAQYLQWFFANNGFTGSTWVDQIQFVAGPSCPPSISPGNQTYDSSAATGTVAVTAQEGCAWSVFNTNSWVTILSDTSGSGSGAVIYALSDNSTSVARGGSIRIGNQSLFITQSGTNDPNSITNAGCPVVLSPTNLTHGFRDSPGLVTITAASTCNWTVVNTNVWIAIVTPFGGNGNGSINYMCAANSSGSTRNGNITVNDQLFLVTQSAGNANPPPDTNTSCSIVLSPTGRTQGFGAASNTFTVVVNSNCSWTVLNTNAWISIASPLSGIGNGSVTYVVAMNPTASTRSGNINVGGSNYLVTQTGSSGGSTNPPPACTISISPANRTHGYATTTGTVAVNTQTGCVWTVVATNPWVSILSSLANTGSGTIYYSIAANTNTQTRSGSVMIGGQPFLLTQFGASSSGTNAFRVQITARTETNATLAVQGTGGKMYVVECSEDFVHWTPISTNSAPSTVTDAAVNTASRRFYRTVEVP